MSDALGNFIGEARHAIHNKYKGFAEYFIAPSNTSQFNEKGILTPEEFVRAGDLLTSRCPTWSWQGGEPSKRKPYLPPNKQFLITKNVPCLKRATALESEAECEKNVEDGDWVDYAPDTTGNAAVGGEDDIDEIEVEASASASQTKEVKPTEQPKPQPVVLPPPKQEEEEDDDDDDDDIDDIGEVMSNKLKIQESESKDAANFKDSQKKEISATSSKPAAAAQKNDNLIESRTYDLTITYDKYYQTPRIWLFGYETDGTPLKTNKILEDIHPDYTHKTVTIDQHPNLNSSWAGIHPCRHSIMMKSMMDRMAENGKVVKVDLYLYLFLKFISAVIPTIQYDFTTQFNM